VTRGAQISCVYASVENDTFMMSLGVNNEGRELGEGIHLFNAIKKV